MGGVAMEYNNNLLRIYSYLGYSNKQGSTDTKSTKLISIYILLVKTYPNLDNKWKLFIVHYFYLREDNKKDDTDTYENKWINIYRLSLTLTKTWIIISNTNVNWPTYIECNIINI